MKKTLTYAGSGVNYADIDPVKVLGQQLGNKTSRLFDYDPAVLPQEGFRGESAYVFKDACGNYFAHIEEGLGTKIKLADFVYQETGTVSGYHGASIDAVAMIVNDMATLGIPPVSVQMHLAVGDGAWLKDGRRIRALMKGWYVGCIQSGAVWTGGETPVLRGIVNPGTAVLAGSAVGWSTREPLTEKIAAGNVIIGLASSGVMANGITLLREVGEAQPDHGLRLFRQALTPTLIYVGAMRALMAERVKVNYAVHVTGHGWRKLMRAKPDFTYRIRHLQPIPGVFKSLQKLGKITDREMWGNYNMGTGFVLIVPREEEARTLKICRSAGYRALTLGLVEKGPKRVVIQPIRLTFKADSMKIRT